MTTTNNNDNILNINWEQYNLSELHKHATSVYRQGGGSRPDVLLININGHQAILKDHNQSDRWFSLLLGPLLVWRESKALRKLAELKGIPNLLCQPDRRSILMEYHESQQITRLVDQQVQWDVFFKQLSTLIMQMHQYGVAHNDLRNPTNILITPDGRPVLVDLVACFCRGQTWNWPANWLYEKFSRVDLSAITKLKSKVAPHLISENDIKAEEIAGSAGMAARQAGQWVRQITRLFFTKNK